MHCNSWPASRHWRIASIAGAQATRPDGAADLIVRNARVTTLDDARPEAAAFAVRGETFVAVGGEEEVMRLRGDRTRVVDAGGRRVIPGLNDSHIHAVRAGRFYNLELRWDGVESLDRALRMIREQAGRTPKGQWVRVIGAWSPHQFVEKRMPTVAELNAAAPDTPVLVLFLYSQGLLNRAGVEALGLTAGSRPPEGGRYEFVDGRRHPPCRAEPGHPVHDDRAAAATLARGPGQFDQALLPGAQPLRPHERGRPGRRWPRLPLGLQGDGGARERSRLPAPPLGIPVRAEGGDGAAGLRDVDGPGEAQPQQGDRPPRRLRARGGGREPRLVGGRFRELPGAAARTGGADGA